MSKISGKTGQIKVDAAIFHFVTADYNVERTIVEVPPDTNTTGEENIDPDIYKGTLSITVNRDITAANPLDTAFVAGGATNNVSITIQPDSTDATYQDVADYRVKSITPGITVGDTQQKTFELMSNGVITFTRP